MVNPVDAVVLARMVTSGTPLDKWPEVMADSMVCLLLPYPIPDGGGAAGSRARMSLDLLRFLVPSARTFSGAPAWLKVRRETLAQQNFDVMDALVDDMHFLISAGVCERGSLEKVMNQPADGKKEG